MTKPKAVPATSPLVTPDRMLRMRTPLRVATAVLGGYAFAWGLVALATCLLFALGLDFHDAEFLGALVGMLGYLLVFLWAIATPRLGRTAIVLLAGGAVMAALASVIQSGLT